MVTQACLPWVSTAFLVAQTRKLAMWFSTKFTAKDLSSVLLSCMVFVSEAGALHCGLCLVCSAYASA